VTASREFARACLESVASHKDAIRKVIAAAETPAATVAVRHTLVARPKPVTVLGYDEGKKDGKRVAGEPREYTVTHVDVGEPTARAQRPFAYLIPAEFKSAIETLQRHGIEVEE